MEKTEQLTFAGFSVMTFNLRFGLAKDGPNAWKFRKKILPNLFNDYPVDFFAFQEVNSFQADDLSAMLPGYRSVGRREPAPSFWQNNIIYYRQDWALTAHQHFYLSPTPLIPSRARDSRWPRQCTIGGFCKHHRALTCINTHFDFKASVQKESSKIIMDRLTNLQLPSTTVLMGDFNASPDSHHFRIFTTPLEKEEGAGFYFRSALPESCSGTQHDFSGKSDGECIDWILYKGDELRLIESRIIRDHVEGAYYSDHFPVTATFQWRNRVAFGAT